MKPSKISLGVVVLLLLVLALTPALIWAADTGPVTATVTPKNISVTVSPSSVGYGTVALSSPDTPPTGDPVITATNNGNVTENFNIKGADSTNWTLSDTAADAEIFMHKFGLWDGTTLGVLTALHKTTYKTLKTTVTASGSQDFKLRINTPTSTTFYVLQTTTVTVQATE